jgi:hypothetical protein
VVSSLCFPEAKYGAVPLTHRRRKVSREVMALEYLDRTRLWVENTQARLRNEHVRVLCMCGASGGCDVMEAMHTSASLFSCLLHAFDVLLTVTAPPPTPVTCGRALARGHTGSNMGAAIYALCWVVFSVCGCPNVFLPPCCHGFAAGQHHSLCPQHGPSI